ncbi:tripartite tricarboxylate transporter substrate binding protein [Verticiella sediminum]|uniref:Tripartite tricarboxylate transporter substrate binding protein n=1 Tax=Verticiella sediminum TaxID=1247510 RepID=A0A556B1G7_9BURK|nr:tripartite tricarboxylate transporter substrate binding protein [Verticiella sediminum]TSH99019.1 tripartite tricarboxylate transporter substrate binding protein [Verticiella sediminum]
MHTLRKAARLGCCALSALVFAFAAGAAAAAAPSYPAKPIRLIVPFPAGGGGDTLARLVSTRLEAQLGQTIIIENQPGAGGNIGSAAAARAQPDGHTLLYGTNGTFAINHALYKSPGFAPEDFTPVAQLTRIGALFVVRPDLPYRTLPELVAAAKAAPHKLTAASAGNGTTSHLALEMLNSQAGVRIMHIPYRGGALAIADVMGGQVDMMIDVVPNTGPQVRAKRVRALAVSTAEPLQEFADLPSVAQAANLPNYDVVAWDGIFAPKGTPPAVVQRLGEAIQAALAEPDLREQLRQRGAEVAHLEGDDFAAFIADERKRWGAVVEQAGARID